METKIPSLKDDITQLIIFRVSDEEFGIPIDTVREIIKSGMITPIPKSPAFIKGIINVRGEIVTTIDLKIRFGFTDDGEQKHIIVTKHNDTLFGLLVDEVIEVLRISKKDIQPTPQIVTKIKQKYINGVIPHEKRLIILLDLANIFASEEFVKTHQGTEKKLKKYNVQHENK